MICQSLLFPASFVGFAMYFPNLLKILDSFGLFLLCLSCFSFVSFCSVSFTIYFPNVLKILLSFQNVAFLLFVSVLFLASLQFSFCFVSFTIYFPNVLKILLSLQMLPSFFQFVSIVSRFSIVFLFSPSIIFLLQSFVLIFLPSCCCCFFFFPFFFFAIILLSFPLPS